MRAQLNSASQTKKPSLRFMPLHSAYAGVKLPSWAWLLCIVLYLLIGLSPYHYWDEYFYLYSVYMNEPATLMALELDLGGFFPAGFFSGKAGLVFLLDTVVDYLGPGYASLKQINILFFAQTALFLAASYILFRQLLPRTTAALAWLCLAFSPLNLYFGGKLLSEVPSLLCLALASIALLKGCTTTALPRTMLWCALSAVAVAIACWFRLTSALYMLGFIVAIATINSARYPLKNLIKTAAITGVLAISLLAVLMFLSGVNPLQSVAQLSSNLAGRDQTILLKLYALGSSVQLFVLLFLAGIALRWRQQQFSWLLWLSICTLPFVFGSSYLEPRFLYLGLLPFAILCGLGLQRLASFSSQRYPSSSLPAAALLGFLAIVCINRFVFLPIMPYEHDQPRLQRFVHQVEIDHTKPIYYSWLSDFCFARFAFPEQNAKLTMSWTYNGQSDFYQSPALLQWAGANHVLAKPPTNTKQATYMGWSLSPVIAKLTRTLSLFGVDVNLREGQKNHLALGWPWEEVKDTQPVQTDGHYRTYAYPNKP